MGQSQSLMVEEKRTLFLDTFYTRGKTSHEAVGELLRENMDIFSYPPLNMAALLPRLFMHAYATRPLDVECFNYTHLKYVQV